MAALRTSAAGASAATAAVAGLWNGVDVRKEVDRILLSKYSPASVVVDDDLEVVEIRGKASPYLTLPVGKVSFNLMKLIPDTGLFLEVEKLIQQACKSGEPARQERVPYEHDGTSGVLNLEVMPLDSSQGRSTLVLFDPVPGAVGPDAALPDPPHGDDARYRQISRLKQQLAEAKERFLCTIEARQVSREESQNTTEEALQPTRSCRASTRNWRPPRKNCNPPTKS
jgi:two-component system CheB/CheR fusion protein